MAYEEKVAYEVINVTYESEDFFFVLTFFWEKWAYNLKNA